MRFIVAVLAALLISFPAAAQTVSDSTAFLNAVRDRDGATASRILEGGGAGVIGARDGQGDTALHIAIRRRDAGWVAFLLARGADPNLPTRAGEPPLVTAAQLGFLDAVQLLLRARANVDAANRRGETPLIAAVQARNLPVVQLLLRAGGSATKTDSVSGRSALDYARQDRRSAAILRALEAGPSGRPVTPSLPAAAPTSRAAPSLASGTLQSLVRDEDYPEAALSARQQGTTLVDLQIGLTGRVQSCTVLQSSGHSVLDAATCRIIRSRARYDPALDASGNPTVANAKGALTWRLPG